MEVQNETKNKTFLRDCTSLYSVTAIDAKKHQHLCLRGERGRNPDRC